MSCDAKFSGSAFPRRMGLFIPPSQRLGDSRLDTNRSGLGKAVRQKGSSLESTAGWDRVANVQNRSFLRHRGPSTPMVGTVRALAQLPERRMNLD
jgi:hypothetical protein